MSSSFSFGRIEKTRAHLLADTAELALIFGGFSQIAEADLLSIIRQSPAAGKDLMDLDEEDIDDDGHPDGMGGAEINASEQGYIEECFRQIDFRVSAFATNYPFYTKDNVLYRCNLFLDKHYLYLFLLSCARTRSFGKRITQRLADNFELASAAALTRMVSPDAEIIMFGPNARKSHPDFSSNLVEAIPKLAKKMGCKLTSGWDKNLNPQGDGKIDLVAIYSFDLYSEGYHVLIGQCASIEDEHAWQKKRQEAAMHSMRGFFSPLVDAQAALFIPACFREANGSWYRDNDVSGVIVIDRLRLINILQSSGQAEFPAREIYAKLFEPAAAA